MNNLSDDSKSKVKELITMMLALWDETSSEDVEGFYSSLKKGKASYLAEILDGHLSTKELCIVDILQTPLIQNFQDTGIKVTEMVKRMHVHLAI